MSDEMDELVDRARKAQEAAYAPYSGFQVGAAVAADAGVFSGCNVENASFGLTICAERLAAATAVAAGAKRIDAVAITSSAQRPTPPCGACRQFLYEFGPGMTVVSVGGTGERRVWRLSGLLADAFGASSMEQPS
jgi:cytidine deaminase